MRCPYRGFKMQLQDLSSQPCHSKAWLHQPVFPALLSSCPLHLASQTAQWAYYKEPPLQAGTTALLAAQQLQHNLQSCTQRV